MPVSGLHLRCSSSRCFGHFGRTVGSTFWLRLFVTLGRCSYSCFRIRNDSRRYLLQRWALPLVATAQLATVWLRRSCAGEVLAKMQTSSVPSGRSCRTDRSTPRARLTGDGGWCLCIFGKPVLRRINTIQMKTVRPKFGH